MHVQKLKIKPVSLESREDVLKSQNNQAGDQAPKGDRDGKRIRKHYEGKRTPNSKWTTVSFSFLIPIKQ